MPRLSFLNTSTRVTVFILVQCSLVTLTNGPSFSKTCTRVDVLLTGAVRLGYRTP
jgi:hypothetical protein